MLNDDKCLTEFKRHALKNKMFQLQAIHALLIPMTDKSKEKLSGFYA